MLNLLKEEIHQGVYIARDNKTKGKSNISIVFNDKFERLFLTNKKNNVHTMIDHLENVHEVENYNILPFSITIIEIKNYNAILRIFSKILIERSTELLNDCIYRSVDINSDSIYLSHDGSYIIISFKKNMNSVTKTADDFLKRIAGLTIPYPKTHVYSDINVNIGIAYFTDLNSNIDSEKIFKTALGALEKSKLTNKVEILTGVMP